jgi:uncharacterized protein YkwD
LRKLTAAILAVPVIAILYLSLIVKRSATSRIVLVLASGAFLTIGVVGLGGPARTAATPPSTPIPVTSAAVRNDLRVGQAPNAQIAIAFSTPMNQSSVAASLKIEPAAAVDLRWNADNTQLTVVPTAGWRPGGFYTITVQPGALAQTGRPLSQPARAAFLVRAATQGTITAVGTSHGRVGVDATFLVAFDHPVSAAAILGAVQVKPAVAGTITPVTRAGASSAFVFDPTAALQPDTQYRLALSPGVRDVDGAVVAARAIAFHTVAGPRIVRFRPLAKTTHVDSAVNVSVRFSEPMDQRATKAAFSVEVGGRAVGGKVTFAENDRVLVFDPRGPLPNGRRVVISVGASARSKAGIALGKSSSAYFATVVKTARRATHRATSPISRGGGGSVGGGTWSAVESYYLKLMNCTRTGGWVTSSGSCSSPGGRAVAPLRIDRSIASRVSRPYAKLLATHGWCNHFINGTPGDRLRRAGYTSYIWAENLGCRSGNPYSAVLGSHLFFQSERSYNGGHYVNLMNAKYDRVGIGVWVSSGRVRLVIDFYHPR